jgi:hypothetical protein
MYEPLRVVQSTSSLLCCAVRHTKGAVDELAQITPLRKLADLPKQMKAELPTMLRLAVDVTFNAADKEPFLGGARMALPIRHGQLLASRALAHA